MLNQITESSEPGGLLPSKDHHPRFWIREESWHYIKWSVMPQVKKMQFFESLYRKSINKRAQKGQEINISSHLLHFPILLQEIKIMVMISLHMEAILPELGGSPKVQTPGNKRKRWENGLPYMFQRPQLAGETYCIELHTKICNFVLIASSSA